MYIIPFGLVSTMLSPKTALLVAVAPATNLPTLLDRSGRSFDFVSASAAPKPKSEPIFISTNHANGGEPAERPAF